MTGWPNGGSEWQISESMLARCVCGGGGGGVVGMEIELVHGCISVFVGRGSRMKKHIVVPV